MAVKKADATEDKKATDTSVKVDLKEEASKETSDGITVTESDKTAEVKDTSTVGHGDVANTEETREVIAENKGGEVIADAPTVDAPVREVTVDEAKFAASIGRPIPGVDLKTTDMPEVQTTFPEHLDNSRGIETSRFGKKADGSPRTKRVVGSPHLNEVNGIVVGKTKDLNSKD